MTKLDGGELLARTLAKAGVKEVFALHGGHLESFLQGCVHHNVRLTDTRHEAAAGHAADGYAVDWLNALVYEMATRTLWFFWSDRICVFSYGLMMDGNITASECVWAAARVQVPTRCHPPSLCGFSP